MSELYTVLKNRPLATVGGGGGAVNRTFVAVIRYCSQVNVVYVLVLPSIYFSSLVTSN